MRPPPRPEPGPALVEQLARNLVDLTGHADVAFLVARDPAGDRVLFAAHPEDDEGPFSAATDLVQGIHEAFHAAARKLVRATIWTTRPANPFSLGMTRVAARRLRGPIEPRDHGLVPGLELRSVPWTFVPRGERPEGAPAGATHEEWMRVALGLVPAPDPAVPLHARDRRAAALLVSPEGELLGGAANTNARNRTLHAELNVLSAWWHARHAKLPRGTRLYATLEPCRMCAGLAWQLASEPGGLEVFYAREDPGPAARNSILREGSEARARFARSEGARNVRCLARVRVDAPPGEGAIAPP